MASGIKHDQMTKILSIPFGVLMSLILNIQTGLLSSVAFLIGGLWLSPDLDTNSLPLKRWGPLKIIWWPYRKFINHRSILSHGPFIGTIMRIGYLISIIFLLIHSIQKINLMPTFLSFDMIKNVLRSHSQQLISIFIGIEASAWIHIIQDKDPLPKN